MVSHNAVSPLSAPSLPYPNISFVKPWRAIVLEGVEVHEFCLFRFMR